MADGTIAVGQTVNDSGDVIDTFTFSAPATTLVLQLNGPTSVMAGIWTGTEAVPPNGVLRVCGANSWGRHTFKMAGPCVIQVTNSSGGAYTITLRKWTIWDNFQMNPLWNLHKSTC